MSAPLTDSSGKPLETGEYEIDGKKVNVVSRIIDGSDSALGKLPSPNIPKSTEPSGEKGAAPSARTR